MIAAGIAALVLVSVLLAFHGWPTNASTGTVGRVIAATTTTQGHVPTLVIGNHSTAGATPAHGAALARQTPATRQHNAANNAPLFNDAIKPKTPGSPPGKKIGPPGCTGITCGTPITIPSQIDQIITTGQENASSLGQQVSDGVSQTTQTVGGVLNDVTKAVGKAVGGH